MQSQDSTQVGGAKASETAIQSDGRTVWVHGPQGTIGRFSIFGIDVHTTDTAACLHCTHERTSASDWDVFGEKMLEHHGVMVSDEHRPRFLGSAESA